MKINDTNEYELIKLLKEYFFDIDQMSNNFSNSITTF